MVDVVKSNYMINDNKLNKLIDSFFDKKYMIYRHLQNSYNGLIDNVVSYLENNDNLFDENRIDNLVYKYRFKFSNMAVRPPLHEDNITRLYPYQARELNLTYSIKIVGDIEQIQEVYDLTKTKTIDTKVVGKVENETILILPCMVRSKYCTLSNPNNESKDCEFDPGGYFIVNGSEKIVLCLERMINNKPIVFYKKDGDNENYKVKINSKSTNQSIMMQSIEILIGRNTIINVKVPILSETSVFILMRALGFETDREIMNCIVYNENDTDMINILKFAIDNSKKEGKKIITTKEDAILSLIGKLRVVKKYMNSDKKLQQIERKEHLLALLRNAFMPHMNSERHNDVLKAKGYFLGYMINKLLNSYLGRKNFEPDDRDSFINKRIDTQGDLIFDLVKQGLKKIFNECNKFHKKRTGSNHSNPINIISKYKPSNIEQNIKSSMMTGNWGKKKGVAQMYQRLTFYQSITFLRRVDSGSGKTSSTMKLTGPRHYHGSQGGFLCVVESPEHSNIGLVKNLALMATIITSPRTEVNDVYNLILKNKNFIHMNNFQPAKLKVLTKIFLDGEWIGFTEKPMVMKEELLRMKRNNVILRTDSVTFDTIINEIRVNTDSGRLSRPLLRVQNNELLLKGNMIDDIVDNKENNKLNKWELFLEKYPDVIEYVDAEEQYYHLVASNQKKIMEMKERDKNVFEDSNDPIINRYDNALIERYSHCEFDPSMLLGIIAANIPFANHNFGSRNIYQYAQGKQAMSLYSSNYKIRLDITYILYNTQRPLVNTTNSKRIHSDILSCGENIYAMIGCYSGYNQDDGIIMNQSAIDRGMFVSISLKKWESKKDTNQTTSEADVFMKPDLNSLVGGRHANYDKLNDRGYTEEETIIDNGDVLIGKVTPIQPVPGSDKHFKDSSTIYKSHESAIIDKVFLGKNSEGYEMIKIRTRSKRIPKIGDKFCLRIDLFEVLTKRGWLKFDNITMEDEIATLVNDTDLVYEKPIGIYKFNYKGQMYKVRSQQVDIDVTMDHSMYIKEENEEYYKLIEAKNIKKNYVMKKDINEYKNNYLIINNSYETNVLIKLMAKYIISKINNVLNLVIINNFDSDFEFISKLLKNDTIQETLVFYTDELQCIFKILNVNEDEIYEKIINRLNKEQSKIFIDELFDKNNIIEITENNKVIIDNITVSIIHSGYTFNIENNKLKLLTNYKNKIVTEKNIEIYDYDGTVGCLEVPSHVFMIKQNDKNVWSGNCCYTSDHEVLTNNGWKSVNNITKNDKVASLINGNTLKYQNPTAIQEYDYNDELYKIKSNQIDLVVTKNHRMYVGPERGDGVYKILTAEEIYGKKRRYKKNVENYIPKYSTKKIEFKAKNKKDKLIFDLEPWLIFFGIWIAEGCYVKSSNDIRIAVHKPRVKEALEKVFEEMKIHYTKQKDNANDNEKNSWRITTHKKLLKYFEKLSVGSVNKSLPDWVWKLDQEQCRKLITGMMLGDGHTMENGTERYDTSSTKLADDFQKLCLHAGWSCNKMIKYKAGKESVVKGTGEVIKSTVDAYRLTIIKSQNNPLVNKNITKTGENRHDSYINFNDDELKNCIKNKVYCCTVPGDGVIYVRRNGIVSWCGNSRHGQKGVIGLTMSESDLPFTKHGLVPDIIVNPNAIPSRMTVAHLLECIYGKVAAFKGIECDATPFKPINLEEVGDALESLGFKRNGREDFYSGITGEKIKSDFFFGPTFYQRLKHLVSDKIHCLLCDKAEILTDNGWKFYHQLTDQDKVATLKNDEIVYEVPQKIFYYENFDGDIYSVNNNNIEIDVTMEHRMWVSTKNSDDDKWSDYHFELAKDIVGKKVIYKQNCENKLKDNEIFNSNENRNYTEKIIINENNERSLPSWVFKMSQKQSKNFLLSLNIFNPQYYENELNNFEYYTCSKKLADQLQQLAIHAGMVAEVYKLNDKENIWICYFRDKQIISSSYEEKIYSYSGSVFCVQVESGVFMVRQNGKVCWTGNSRARGPVTMLTRQPPEGRSKDGGFRCGEMERDTIISYGMSKFLKERFVDIADKYSCYVCDKCGLFAQRIVKKENAPIPQKYDSYQCMGCKNETKITKVIIPYAFKLLIQELMSINIAPRIKTKKYDI